MPNETHLPLRFVASYTDDGSKLGKVLKQLGIQGRSTGKQKGKWDDKGLAVSQCPQEAAERAACVQELAVMVSS